MILLAWLNDFILGPMRNVKNVMKCICAAYIDSRKKHFEPPHDKPYKMTFVPSKDSDQPDLSLCWAHKSFCWFYQAVDQFSY